MVAAVKGGDGTIGYADESQAGGLGIVSVKVGEEFVAPSAEGAAKVARGLQAGRGPRGRRHGASTSTAPRPSPAPTRSLLASYLIACQTYDDANEADLVKGFLSYIVSEDGQQAAAEQAGSAPLDSELAAAGGRDRRRDLGQVARHLTDVRRPGTPGRRTSVNSSTPDRSPVSVTAPPQQTRPPSPSSGRATASSRASPGSPP